MNNRTLMHIMAGAVMAQRPWYRSGGTKRDGHRGQACKKRTRNRRRNAIAKVSRRRNRR